MITLFRNYSTLHSAFLRRQSAADISNALAKAQEELSTGFKTDVFASLGVRASESLDLRASSSRDEAQILANNLLSGRMDTMASALGTMRDSVQSVLELAIPNKDAPLGTASGVQDTARTALETLISQASSAHGGVSLFAGTVQSGKTMQGWTEVNPDTGLSPSDVMQQILAGGLADATAANDAIARLEAAFGNSSGTAGWNYDATFYNGSSQTGPRQSAVIGENTTLTYGVQANDSAFRDTMMGLAMLASVDPQTIDDPAAYKAWMNTAVSKLTSGQNGLLATETQVGAQQAQIETANTRMQDRIDLYNGRIVDLEGVDSYEAATRITLLESQLQASYAVTSRLSQLSFLNYMY